MVSCDNLANNAIAARAAIGGLADVVDPGLGAWIAENVSFVGTSIDRITPRTTDAEIALVEAECGYADSSPVVTEPFSDWVLSGDFPAGRPDWASAGAVFVDEIEHFENRKLWLLNGAHSLMAYAGQLRGHETVAQALADPVCAAWVQQFWDEAEANLPAEGLNIPAYRAALLERFGNARIAHHLAQIAMDGSNKLRMRAVPVFKAEKAAGRSGTGALRMIAAWVAFIRDSNAAGKAIADAAGSAGITAALALDSSGEAAMPPWLRWWAFSTPSWPPTPHSWPGSKPPPAPTGLRWRPQQRHPDSSNRVRPVTLPRIQAVPATTLSRPTGLNAGGGGALCVQGRNLHSVTADYGHQ